MLGLPLRVVDRPLSRERGQLLLTLVLSGLVLDESWISTVDFSASDLSKTSFEFAPLNGAQLERANLVSAKLRGTRFERAMLDGADLRNAKLVGAALTDASVRWANLWDADLEGANLRGAQLRGACLCYANFDGADLTAADLTGADLRAARNLTPEQVDRACIDPNDGRAWLPHGFKQPSPCPY